MLAVWQRRHEQDVLLLFYEDMVADPQAQVRRVAGFLGLLSVASTAEGPTPQSQQQDTALVNAVCEQTSHKAMRDRGSAFSDDWAKTIMRERMKYTTEDTMAQVAKVRKDGGRTGQGKQHVAQEIAAAYDRIWDAYAAPRTGFASYADMRTAWKRELAGPAAD